jgi:hypothetical protein
MFIRLTLTAMIAATAVSARADESEAVRFAIFHGYTSAIEEACPSYFVYLNATLGSHLSPGDRAAAMAIAPEWRKEMRRSVKALGCDAAARDALAFTDLSFTQVWEHKQ